MIITTAFKNIKGKLSRKDMLCDMKITMNSKQIYVNAIIDTGNFLKDPISKSPVVVVEKGALCGKIDAEVLDSLDNIISGEYISIDEQIPKIRLIPFTSLGRENGILVGMKADAVKINYDGREIYVKNVIIGIYNGKLSKNNRYAALIGLELLEYEGGEKSEYLGDCERQNNDNTYKVLK